MKHFKIEVPPGYEIDQEKSTFENIVFKEKSNKYPKTWEEVADSIPVNEFMRKQTLLKRFEKLLLLRDIYRDGWKPDYMSPPYKYVIYYYNNSIKHGVAANVSHVLCFQTKEIRDLFSQNFESLIEECKELI